MMRIQSQLALIALAASIPAAASACGGFFCSQVPMDQSGEQILFAVDGEDVTAHIQIQYQGEPADFSWVLPLPSQPSDYGVGTELLFERLRTTTDPRFQIQWNNDEGCNYTNQCPCYLEDAGSDGGDGEPVPGGGGGVTVLDEVAVGPFDIKVVQSDDGTALFQWLQDNGYDQPPEAEGLIGYYVNLDHVFLALKLQSDKSTGDLQPLVIKYSAPNLACIPLKLTSIAATPDMPVFSWVLARARAVPMNFFHLTLNPKGFDWLNCATPAGDDNDWCGSGGWNPAGVDCDQQYMNLVTQAANTANGHAFVTEYAGASSVMAEQLYRAEQYDLDKLKTLTEPAAFLQEMLSQGFPRVALVQEVIKKAIPKPVSAVQGTNCETDQQFYATWNIEECLQYMPEGFVFDPVATVQDLDDRVITPLREAQDLFTNYSYLTRLFTTISPDEMTKDPIFSFNPDLPDVSNVFTVSAKATCKDGSSNKAEAITLTFADGDTATLTGDFDSCQGWADGGDGVDGGGIIGDEPVATIEVLSEEGGPETVAPDQVHAKEAELDMRTPTPGADRRPTTPASGTRTSNSGCVTGDGPLGIIPTVVLLFVTLLGLQALRARRQ